MSLIFSPEQDQYLQLAQTCAYYKGMREGITLYAHYKDGVQYVGTTGRTLKDALSEIDKQECDLVKRYGSMV